MNPRLGCSPAGALPVAELVRLEGQRHFVKANATVPVVKRFLLDQVDKSLNPASGADSMIEVVRLDSSSP